MTIGDIYQQLSGRISLLSGDETSIQRLKAIVSRLNNLSKAHGSDEVGPDIEKIVNRFELRSDYLSAIESYLNKIDATIKDSLSGASSSTEAQKNERERRYTKMNKKFTVLQIIFMILTIVVSLAAVVFLALGLIEEINYDMLAFYITLGGAVVSLVGLIISLNTGKSSDSGEGGARSGISNSFNGNTDATIRTRSDGSPINDSFNGNTRGEYDAEIKKKK